MKDLLSNFNSISLEEMDGVSLQKRKDTKYIFESYKLFKILEELEPFYRVLCINSENIFLYDNLYLDTKNLIFYMQHHNQMRNRFKVRYRKYIDTNEKYFEIKIKDNKDQTIKNRLKMNIEDESYSKDRKDLISKLINLSPDTLSPKINIKFSRITLVDNDLNERLTIDTKISVKNKEHNKEFYNLVVSEIKQKKYNPKSKFIRVLHNNSIREMRFSKYCMGLIFLNKKLKHNRFKPKVLALNKILYNNYN